MKDFLKAMGVLAVMLGIVFGFLLVLKRFCQRTYITVQENL